MGYNYASAFTETAPDKSERLKELLNAIGMTALLQFGKDHNIIGEIHANVNIMPALRVVEVSDGVRTTGYTFDELGFTL